MEKQKEYNLTRFSGDVIKEAYETFVIIAKQLGEEINLRTLLVEHHDSTWRYDDITEFFADYRKFEKYARFSADSKSIDLSITTYQTRASITVSGHSRTQIETIFEIFEKHQTASSIPETENTTKPVVFIGHGRSSQWRDLKDHIQDKHGYAVEAYESGARAGHHIRDILDEMASKSSFALLVLTAEDEQSDGSYRCRQNVVHETGLFQGKLGFSRAVILLEEGAEEFSNVHGVQQIRFQKNNIKETFGEVVATLRREFS